jgi:hypothetical protein
VNLNICEVKGDVNGQIVFRVLICVLVDTRK